MPISPRGPGRAPSVRAHRPTRTCTRTLPHAHEAYEVGHGPGSYEAGRGPGGHDARGAAGTVI
ncbi:hypothetical protein OG453_42910 [Streptomyces sp. NBC_01381]|uniref:hypothetical protein n=1 Tax=Streptomyces sp. NBC_01381 TaxID=2903845 RepID=UPI00224DF1D1|nr:hypothetical protein [Streptomyces sp. NBC_01381]MCX4673313.1 hypothetical protein [Streptomyces sp. NBC_01381]